MQHTIDQQDGVTVVHVAGDIDVSHTLVLREAIAGPLACDAPRLVMDLAEVGFMDSAGIGLLVTAHRRAEQAGGRLVVAALGDAVSHVLTLTRADRLLTVVPSVEEGLVAVRAAQ